MEMLYIHKGYIQLNSFPKMLYLSVNQTLQHHVPSFFTQNLNIDLQHLNNAYSIVHLNLCDGMQSHVYYEIDG